MPSNARVTGSQAQPSPNPAQLRPPPPRNQAPASLCQAARTRPRPPSVTGLSSYNVIGVFDTLRHPRGRDTLQVSCIETIFGWWGIKMCSWRGVVFIVCQYGGGGCGRPRTGQLLGGAGTRDGGAARQGPRSCGEEGARSIRSVGIPAREARTAREPPPRHAGNSRSADNRAESIFRQERRPRPELPGARGGRLTPATALPTTMFNKFVCEIKGIMYDIYTLFS